jgi:hypothetical protein
LSSNSQLASRSPQNENRYSVCVQLYISLFELQSVMEWKQFCSQRCFSLC